MRAGRQRRDLENAGRKAAEDGTEAGVAHPDPARGERREHEKARSNFLRHAELEGEQHAGDEGKKRGRPIASDRAQACPDEQRRGKGEG
ncbi:MAG: hypothetical protein ACREF0_18475, partial [Acetobacteraceae bacterium]